MISLTLKEAVGLYLIMQKQEDRLTVPMRHLFTRIERYIFPHFSIDEMEHLDEIFAQGSHPAFTEVTDDKIST